MNVYTVSCLAEFRRLTQQQFRRSVPQCDHTVGVAVPLAVFGQAERSSQAEVSQFQDAVSGDEHVGRLHVSVKDLTTNSIMIMYSINKIKNQTG